MTICVAALFPWNYSLDAARPSFGAVAITASDRKITAGDIGYEPQQLKIAGITPRCLVLIAGDYAFHSEAIQQTQRQTQGNVTTAPLNVATIYGQAIQSIKRRQAEDLILAPLGMNTDTFIAQQKDLAEGFVNRITDQLQSYQGEDVEALVVGSDGINAHIYSVDTRGMVACLDDVGFAAIGSGAWHAKSRLMQGGYVKTVTYAQALAAVFAAKKAAEVAPGVGTYTDLFLIFKEAVEPLRLDIVSDLHETYAQYQTDRVLLETAAIERLQEAIKKLTADPQPGNSSEETGSPTSNDGESSAAARDM